MSDKKIISFKTSLNPNNLMFLGKQNKEVQCNSRLIFSRDIQEAIYYDWEISIYESRPGVDKNWRLF